MTGKSGSIAADSSLILEAMARGASSVWMKKLLELSTFLPAFRNRKLYGILAVVDAPKELCEKVLKEGLYLARIHDDLFELEVPGDFQPHSFQA